MIYVLGSIQNEITLEVERMPKKGESVTADSCSVNLGGKGANQAIAIAKLSRRDDSDKQTVRLIGHVGKDVVGNEIKATLASYGVDTTYVHSVRRATGMVITSATEKEKRTFCYGGANNTISKTDIDEALEHAGDGDTLLCQLDVPLYVVLYALKKAHSIGMTTVLNPVPAKALPEEVYCNVDIIAANYEATHMLTGINPNDFSAQKNAMRFFHAHGVQYVVLTLGDNGCSLSDGAHIVSHIPPRKTEIIDITSAGDSFVGALTLTYPRVGMYSFEEACVFAGKAAAITVSRLGAAESMPNMEEVIELYNHYID